MNFNTDSACAANDQLHGIEGLAKGSDGFVTWKGQVVEHYSFTDANIEREATMSLARRCRQLEEKRFPINMGTSTGHTPFADAPAGTPWVQAMSYAYTAFASKDGRCRWLILQMPHTRHAIAVSMRGSRAVIRYSAGDGISTGCYAMFHTLQNEGLDCANKRLGTYPEFIACMAEIGITPDAVADALATPLPEFLTFTAAA